MNDMTRWQALASTAQTMVRLATENDWERLTATYREFENHLRALQQSGGGWLSADQRQQRADLIRSILDDFTTVRGVVGPWMDDVRPLLESWSTNRSSQR